MHVREEESSMRAEKFAARGTRTSPRAAATGSGRGGFTLIEIIIAVAIVAILAGTVTPLAFREYMRAREDATLAELATLEQALLAFYEDTGRLPTEAEGLAALVSDPGVTGWQGPYAAGDQDDPVTDVATDAFGDLYLYDLDPGTNPAGAADLVLASGGTDHTVTFGSVGGVWTLDTEGDDLLQLVSSGPVDRDKIVVGNSEMTLIAAAAGMLFCRVSSCLCNCSSSILSFSTLTSDCISTCSLAPVVNGLANNNSSTTTSA